MCLHSGPEAGSPARVRLAPTFDHAASLGRNETDERRRERLGNKDRGAGIEAYRARTRSAFYAAPDTGKPMAPFDAFAWGTRWRGAAANYWRERLAGLASEDLEAIFRQAPPDLILEPAIDFALRMLAVNRSRTLDA